MSQKKTQKIEDSVELEDDVYQVERICDKRIKKGVIQ